jgi:hypothetical protein
MSYQMEFRRAVARFTDEVRRLARQELMDELKKRDASRPKRYMTTRAKVVVKQPPYTPSHVPGGGRKCRVPGCGKVSKGPRYDFFCADHRTMSKAAKKAVKLGLAQPKKGNGMVTPPSPKPEGPVVRAKTAKVIVGNGPVKIEYDGRTLTREQWSRKLGLNKDAVRHRMRRGMSALKAITLGA